MHLVLNLYIQFDSFSLQKNPAKLTICYHLICFKKILVYATSEIYFSQATDA